MPHKSQYPQELRTQLAALPQEQRKTIVDLGANIFAMGYVIVARAAFEDGREWHPNYQGLDEIRGL